MGAGLGDAQAQSAKIFLVLFFKKNGCPYYSLISCQASVNGFLRNVAQKKFME